MAKVLVGQSLANKYFQTFMADTVISAEKRFIAYPTLAFTPETSWEFGISGLYVFNAKENLKNRLSEVSAFAFYTVNDQFGIWFDHAIYTDRNDWFYLGRIRYQQFPLLYFGQGFDTQDEHLAIVDGNFTLIKERVLRKLNGALYTGLEFDVEYLQDADFQWSDGIPTADQILPIASDGSLNIGFGWGVIYDERENVLNVREGFYTELAFLNYGAHWGGDYNFNQGIIDARYYKSVNKRDVFATQAYGQFTDGNEIPFNMLALMGGESLMRGYYLGRYRDNNYVAAQMEYRFLPLNLGFTKRIGANIFASAGNVYNMEKGFNFNETLLAGGVGLQFLLFPDKDIYTRFDVAFTEEGNGFYFFIGEAF